MPSRPADVVALASWMLVVALVTVAAIVGPEGQCDYGNADAYRAAARSSGAALAAAALAMVAAGSFLAAGALAGDRTGRSRALRGVGALVALALAAVAGFIALLELIGFGCLE